MLTGEITKWNEVYVGSDEPDSLALLLELS